MAGRLQPGLAGEMLFSQEGASLVDAALFSTPAGAAGDPARRHLLLALVAAGRAVHNTGAAESGELLRAGGRPASSCRILLRALQARCR